MQRLSNGPMNLLELTAHAVDVRDAQGVGVSDPTKNDHWSTTLFVDQKIFIFIFIFSP